MEEEIEFPHFSVADLPEDLAQHAGIVSIAGVLDDVHVQLEVLKEVAVNFMLHTKSDGRWCLHLPEIFGEEEALVHSNLCHVLTAGVAFSIKYILDRRTEASLN